MECDLDEGRIPCQVCSNYVNIYKWERLAYFSNQIAITFNLANKGKRVNFYSIVLTHVYRVDSMDRALEIDCNKISGTWQEGNHLLFGTGDICLLKALVSNHKWTYTCWFSKIATSARERKEDP